MSDTYVYAKCLQITEDDIAIQDSVRNNLEKLLERYNHLYNGNTEDCEEYIVRLYQDYNCSFYRARVRVSVKHAENFLLEIKTLGVNVKVEEVVSGEVGDE